MQPYSAYLPFITKRRLEPIVHNGLNDPLHSLSIVDIRERFLRHGHVKELTEWLPAICHFENQQSLRVNGCPDIGNMFIEAPDKMIMIVHPAIKVAVDCRFQVSARVRARLMVGEGGVAGAGR